MVHTSIYWEIIREAELVPVFLLSVWLKTASWKKIFPGYEFRINYQRLNFGSSGMESGHKRQTLHKRAKIMSVHDRK